MKIKQGYHFRNWAGNERCHPERFFQPQTHDEIIAIVREAVKAGRKLRVTGAGHSWSPIACTGDYMVNLDLYNKVIRMDKEKKRVTVQAGIRLKELNKILDENGLALSNLGSICEQSVAGLMTTGTHGTGISFQILSSAIIGMKVITSSGEVMEIDETSAYLNAFRVSLGVLGIISEITLQCSDAFNLREESGPVWFDEALEQLPELLQRNDHVKLWWFPHVRRLMLYRYNRAEKMIIPRASVYSSFLKWTEDVFLVRYFFALMLRVGNLLPKQIPAINRFICRIHLKKIQRAGKSHEIFNVPMPPRHRESEYAIPVERAADALDELRREIEHRRMKVNFVVEVRFVKSDSIWLSPAYGRDSCYIGGYLYGDKRWQPYLELFEGIMKKYDGRPHWGKEFSPELHDFGKLYPRWFDFLKLKQQMDSSNRFANSLTEKLFG